MDYALLRRSNHGSQTRQAMVDGLREQSVRNWRHVKPMVVDIASNTVGSRVVLSQVPLWSDGFG